MGMLPRESQSEHTSQNSNPLMSSLQDSAAWTSCPVLGSWAVWTHGGRIAQAWLGRQAEEAEGGHCSPKGREGTQVSPALEISDRLLSTNWQRLLDHMIDSRLLMHQIDPNRPQFQILQTG